MHESCGLFHGVDKEAEWAGKPQAPATLGPTT